MDIQAFLGWMLILNGGLLILSLLFAAAFPNWSWRVTNYFVDLDMKDYHRLNAVFLAIYELLIIFFVLVPYLILRFGLVAA